MVLARRGAAAAAGGVDHGAGTSGRGWKSWRGRGNCGTNNDVYTTFFPV